IKEFGEQGTGNGEREETLAHYRELLESMGRLGIRLLCYNFMVGKGWSRTGVREGRGGAKATYFAKPAAVKNMTSDIGHRTSSAEVGSLKPEVLLLSHEQVWANYEHFIKSVMPTAEKCGIRMGLHPDDPCLPALGGYARIFGSVEAYDRAYALYPSPSNAVTFCQANFKLMLGNREQVTGNGERGMGSENSVKTLDDAARHFGKRIAFIHVRDVEGTKEDFTELFHDQGTTDQFALMRTYRELGIDVPVRGDHVPEMAYDRDLTPEGTPGYFTLGRLFANGYLKALLQGTFGKAELKS
ncbi:MAG: mannonate dehydratase, partial [Kiritimatiellae bacterium]|nr:mannonate dehydratase [Kiritimatiellia bacterium]